MLATDEFFQTDKSVDAKMFWYESSVVDKKSEKCSKRIVNMHVSEAEMFFEPILRSHLETLSLQHYVQMLIAPSTINIINSKH